MQEITSYKKSPFYLRRRRLKGLFYKEINQWVKNRLSQAYPADRNLVNYHPHQRQYYPTSVLEQDLHSDE